jgi:genome maintenance exonuclease 1
MRINKRFEYPLIDKVTLDDGTRYYVCPDTGQHLTSVTTILSATADKAFLVEWEKRVGIKKADQMRKEGTDLGSLMHTHLECHITGDPRPGGNNLVHQMASRMADKIIQGGLKDVDEVWGMESQLFFPGLYAGTTDLVGVYKGKPAIMDHKSAKKMRSRDQIGDYFQQAAAYALSHDERYGTEIETGVIFMVSRDLKYETYVIEGDEFKTAKLKWLDRVGHFFAKAA